MKRLPLVHSTMTTLVDNDVYEWASRSRWRLDTRGYVTLSVHHKNTKKLHRMIMGFLPLHIDHINGNKLDNRKANLRWATCAQNQHNRGPSKTNTSGFKGVSYSAHAKKWIAQIRFNGARMHLGYFANVEDAARAYDAKASELHRDFARLNFALPDLEAEPPSIVRRRRA